MRQADAIVKDVSIESPEYSERRPEPAFLLATDVPVFVSRFPNPFRHPLKASAWIIRNLFGILSLILLLAVVAAVPLLNFVVLGYLLEVEGRVARTGKIRHAFPLLELAPKFGAIVLGIWIWMLPLRLLAGAGADAQLIDPSGMAARLLPMVTLGFSALIAIHLCLALARGGSLSCFFRPIKNVRTFIARLRGTPDWEQTGSNVRQFLAGLRIKHHFWLGLRGFVGAMVWLLIPTALLAFADKTEGGPMLVTVFGGLCLVLVLGWLPMLQAHFAAENRLRAMFELRTVRNMFKRAPIVWLLSIIVVYVLSLPLYLLKAVPPPGDAMWFVTIVFIVSIYPARVMTGWAYHRAMKKEQTAWFGYRWLGRLLGVPLVGAYVFLLFFLTQVVGAHGKAGLFEHHSFGLPVPFMF